MENYEEFTNQPKKLRNDSTMYSVIYKQAMYEALLLKKNIVTIMTTSPLNEFSENSYGIYYTDVDSSECDAIYQEDLYAQYKGKIYKVIQVGGDFANLMLEVDNITNFDIENGFKADFHTHSKPYVLVNREMVDKLLIKKNKLDYMNVKTK